MRIQKVIIFILFMISICLCHGCVAVSLMGDRSAIVNNPIISKYSKGYIGHVSLKPNNYMTEAELIKYWGNPDEIIYNDKGQKQLLYKRSEWRWNGIFAAVLVIPIPLLVPVGHDYLLFTVDNGNISSVYMKTNGIIEVIFYCSLSPIDHGFRFLEKTDNEPYPFYQFIKGDGDLMREESEFGPKTTDSIHVVEP